MITDNSFRKARKERPRRRLFSDYDKTLWIVQDNWSLKKTRFFITQRNFRLKDEITHKYNKNSIWKENVFNRASNRIKMIIKIVCIKLYI